MMEIELQKILYDFGELFRKHKTIDLQKTDITITDFDTPLNNILKDEQLRDLLFRLDEWQVKQRK